MADELVETVKAEFVKELVLDLVRGAGAYHAAGVERLEREDGVGGELFRGLVVGFDLEGALCS